MRRAGLFVGCVVVVACARASVPAKTSADWRPAPGVAEIECDDDPLPEPFDGATLRRECAGNMYSACSKLAEEPHLGATEWELVRQKLGARCAVEPGCGCARYGRALLSDPAPGADVHAADVLDRACHRGVLDACDDMLLQASLCTVSPPSALCTRLRREGRVPAPEPPPPPPRELPPSLARCFVMTAIIHQLNTYCAEHGAAWPHVRAPVALDFGVGAVLCVEPDRFSVRPPSGRWNQRLVHWSVDAERDRATNVELDLDLETDTSFGGTTTVASGCTTAQLVPVDAKWAGDARALPRVEDVCARMKRCVEAVARLFPPPPGDDSGPPELPDDLLGCADYQARTTKLVPSPPPECR